MNDYQKAYGELWSVLKYEPACEIEKLQREYQALGDTGTIS